MNGTILRSKIKNRAIDMKLYVWHLDCQHLVFRLLKGAEEKPCLQKMQMKKKLYTSLGASLS